MHREKEHRTPTALILLLSPLLALSMSGAEGFYACPPDPGLHLPAEGIYPHGRTMAYMGYSGVPGRDLTNGFTVAGPVYGNQAPYLERCVSNDWPVVAHVGLRITFRDKDPNRYKVDPPSLRKEIAAQVQGLAAHRQITWWAIHPEELRPWRRDETNYLALVCNTVRAHDPLQRPIFMYNPNNRTAETLRTVARWVDILGKGCYVNSTKHKRDRGWVRWSVEQELAALRSDGRPGAIALVMPELCRDPDPGENDEIRAWVRHDVYLGLVSGARGVLLWSLFRRGEVRRTWQRWYDAYSECGRELNGERGLAQGGLAQGGLAQIFLFGAARADLSVKQTAGATDEQVELGGNAEPTTTSDAERNTRQVAQASWTSAEFAYGTARWLFVVNSANDTARFTISGWPAGSHVTDVFAPEPRPTTPGEALQLELPPYGVAARRFTAGPHPAR